LERIARPDAGRARPKICINSPMAKNLHKQISKEWATISKEVFRQLKWKYAGGFIFKEKGPFIYEILCGKCIDQNAVSVLFSYKFSALDETFWEITGEKENINKPLSLRVRGVSKAPFKFIERWVQPFQSENVAEGYTDLWKVVEQKISELNKTVFDLESFLQSLNPGEKESSEKCLLITGLIHQKKYEQAIEMLTKAIANGESGGIIFTNTSYYQYALKYCVEVTGKQKLQ